MKNEELIDIAETARRFGFDLSATKQIYRGKDHHCRCGCGGKYADPGTPLFKRYLTEMKKLRFDASKIEPAPASYGGVAAWINIPIEGSDDRCFCLYFKD